MKGMPRYIETEAFEKDVRKRYCKPCKQDGRDHHGIRCRACDVDDMLVEVSYAPTADVQEVKHGRWSCVSEDECNYMCDGDEGCGRVLSLVLGSPEDYDIGYCPFCGAKMDEKESEQ